ncbi:MAG: hypothetical protein FWD71_11160 [Oscillospiraceae bacterium]|nr:hypothetical protein [Oscillospiraceae bacterium]
MDKVPGGTRSLTRMPYELVDIYSLMVHMMVDTDNVLAIIDGKEQEETENPSEKSKESVESILKIIWYNEKVIKGIDKLPEQIRDYIQIQPGYIYNFYFTKYMPSILERLSILLMGLIDYKPLKIKKSRRKQRNNKPAVNNNIPEFFNKTIENLDNSINDIMGENILNTTSQKYTIHYFDNLLSDIFKEIADYHALSRKNYKPKRENEERIKQIIAEADYYVFNIDKYKRKLIKENLYNVTEDTPLSEIDELLAEEMLENLNKVGLTDNIIDIQFKFNARFNVTFKDIPNRALHKSKKDEEARNSIKELKNMYLNLLMDILYKNNNIDNNLRNLITYSLYLLALTKLTEKKGNAEMTLTKYQPFIESSFDKLAELSDSSESTEIIKQKNF